MTISSFQTSKRIGLLDLLRGFAIVSVVFAHASEILLQPTVPVSYFSSLLSSFLHLLREGLVGVQIFFCISGFCIAMSCENILKKNLSPFQSFKVFTIKRIRRIYPPYLVCFFLFLVLVFSLRFTKSFSALHSRSLFNFGIASFFGNLTLTETIRAFVSPTNINPPFVLFLTAKPQRNNSCIRGNTLHPRT